MHLELHNRSAITLPGTTQIVSWPKTLKKQRFLDDNGHTTSSRADMRTKNANLATPQAVMVIPGLLPIIMSLLQEEAVCVIHQLLKKKNISARICHGHSKRDQQRSKSTLCTQQIYPCYKCLVHQARGWQQARRREYRTIQPYSSRTEQGDNNQRR